MKLDNLDPNDNVIPKEDEPNCEAPESETEARILEAQAEDDEREAARVESIVENQDEEDEFWLDRATTLEIRRQRQALASDMKRWTEVQWQAYELFEQGWAIPNVAGEVGMAYEEAQDMCWRYLHDEAVKRHDPATCPWCLKRMALRLKTISLPRP